MFLSEQKFRSIFCSPGCIDNARIGIEAVFVFGNHYAIVSLLGKLQNQHLPVPVQPLLYGDFTFNN